MTGTFIIGTGIPKEDTRSYFRGALQKMLNTLNNANYNRYQSRSIEPEHGRRLGQVTELTSSKTVITQEFLDRYQQ